MELHYLAECLTALAALITAIKAGESKKKK